MSHDVMLSIAKQAPLTLAAREWYDEISKRAEQIRRTGESQQSSRVRYATSNPEGMMRRVAERSFTSPPSQKRTGRSRVIRLLPSGLRPDTVFPQDKQLGVPPRYAPQPVH